MTLSTDSILVKETTSLCQVCKQGIPATIVEQDNKIVMHKHCDQHGDESVLLSSNAAWYHNALNYPAQLKAPRIVRKKVETGCPYDCGACSAHEQITYLPVLAITSACNLDCPICYTINKNDNPYHMPLDEFAGILDVIKTNDPEMKIINITGGEPTLHPQLPELIRLCHDAGIHRITVSTHGLTFINNEKLLEQLAELNTRMVLSFDSFNDDINDRMIGAKVLKAKLKILDQFEKYNIDTTLIPVIAKNVNDNELGMLLELLFTRDCIRSLEIHSMTFTGQGGTGFDLDSRITTYDIIEGIAKYSNGVIKVDDFLPSPCAHPLCYQTCYLLDTADTGFIPFTRFMSNEQIRNLLTDNLYMEPGIRLEQVFHEVINQLWASDVPSEQSDSILRTIKHNLNSMFPSRAISYAEQQRISERSAKTIYIHSHMDEHNFDSDRIRQCCVGVPSADGGNIPTCAYNILYRERDSRFVTRFPPPLKDMKGGVIVKFGTP